MDSFDHSSIHHSILRAYLHGGGGPQVGKVTRLAMVKKYLLTILQPRDAEVKILGVDVALAGVKMSLRRRVVKRCRINATYFPLRFSPIARSVHCF